MSKKYIFHAAASAKWILESHESDELRHTYGLELDDSAVAQIPTEQLLKTREQIDVELLKRLKE